jgi:hypothetical protein
VSRTQSKVRLLPCVSEGTHDDGDGFVLAIDDMAGSVTETSGVWLDVHNTGISIAYTKR